MTVQDFLLRMRTSFFFPPPVTARCTYSVGLLLSSCRPSRHFYLFRAQSLFRAQRFAYRDKIRLYTPPPHLFRAVARALQIVKFFNLGTRPKRAQAQTLRRCFRLLFSSSASLLKYDPLRLFLSSSAIEDHSSKVKVFCTPLRTSLIYSRLTNALCMRIFGTKAVL